ncbi:MAG: hypothetical protein ACOYD3_00580 [Kiritimatiellia bacterium]|jgi:hypothetical protein
MADKEETGTPAEGSAPPRQTPFKPAAAPGTPPAAGASPISPIVRRPTLRRPGEPAAAAPSPGQATPEPATTPAEEPPKTVRLVAPAPQAEEAPKTVRLVAPAQPPAGEAEAPRTVRLVPPTAQQTAAPAASPEAAKRKTSRVELPMTADLTGMAEEREFKTVRLRPMAPPQPGGSPLPEGTKPLSKSQVEAAKSKTSRISLEAALGVNAGLDTGAPKTIRLKRPSELKAGTTGQIAIPTATAATIRKTGFVPPIAGQQSATARLPTQALPPDVAAPAAETEEASPTRRKTIKIKRPSVSTGIKINVSQQAAGDGEASDTEDMQQLSLPPGMQPIGVPDTVNPVFVVAAAVALLLTLGLVWILAAQTFGPNAAITGYTAMKGPDIAPPPGLVSIR